MASVGDRVIVDGREGVIIDKERSGYLVRMYPYRMEKVWVMKGNIKKLNMGDYTVYKGDHYLFSGTQEECAEYLGVQPWTVYYYSTNTHLKRMEQRKTDKPVIVTVRH